ncbi:MAG: hypothetical protein GWO02_18675 [Gammaproteobacteria bacterium]|nr:hypothetical protein [Gammaproteobacteria bacterium]
MTMRLSITSLLITVFVLATVGLLWAKTQAASGSRGAEDRPYKVACEAEARSAADCKVDWATYIGWRSYHAFCARCHGSDALGSSFAPSLVRRVDGMNHGRFLQVVATGFKGKVGVMPSFGDNPNVMPKANDIWAYLNARVDGELPPGRPERFEGAKERAQRGD